MAAEGRLGRITAAGSRLGQQMPLTWVVDPALLETAEDMSDGYTVRAEDPSQPAVDGTGAGTAQQWLDQVRAASRLGDVATLPYADPDVVALRRGGLRATCSPPVAAATRWRPSCSAAMWSPTSPGPRTATPTGRRCARCAAGERKPSS